MFRKNVSGQHLYFQGVDSSTGGIKSGVSWTVRRCIDGTFAAATGTVTEDGTTGWYKFAMSQADTNGNNIGFNFTGTGAVPQTVTIITTDLNPYDAVRAGLTALPNAAADAAGGLPISDAGGLDLDAQIGTKINDILTDTGTTLQGELDGIQADTEDIQARLPAALTADGNIKADTLRVGGTLQTAGDIVGDIAALNDLSAAQVNAEVVDALNVDTYPEPGQGTPPATASLVTKNGYLYKAFRNKIVSTDSQISIYNDAGDTVDQKSAHTDDGTTYTRPEFTSGP